MTRLRLRVGDVFSVPLDDRWFGLGQVVATYGDDAYYFALFEPAFGRDEKIDFEQAPLAPIAFLALSVDAKIACGDWAVLGNYPVADEMPLPAYKEMLGGPDRVDVVDFSGLRRRPAESGETESLANRKIVAPVRLEKALKAKHGLEPWNESYAALRPSPVATTARLFGV